MLAPTYGTTATVAQDGSLLGWLAGWLAGRGGVVAGCEELNPLSPPILCYPICVPVLSHIPSQRVQMQQQPMSFSLPPPPLP